MLNGTRIRSRRSKVHNIYANPMIYGTSRSTRVSVNKLKATMLRSSFHFNSIRGHCLRKFRVNHLRMTIKLSIYVPFLSFYRLSIQTHTRKEGSSLRFFSSQRHFRRPYIVLSSTLSWYGVWASVNSIVFVCVGEEKKNVVETSTFDHSTFDIRCYLRSALWLMQSTHFKNSKLCACVRVSEREDDNNK